MAGILLHEKERMSTSENNVELRFKDIFKENFNFKDDFRKVSNFPLWTNELRTNGNFIRLNGFICEIDGQLVFLVHIQAGYAKTQLDYFITYNCDRDFQNQTHETIDEILNIIITPLKSEENEHIASLANALTSLTTTDKSCIKDSVSSIIRKLLSDTNIPELVLEFPESKGEPKYNMMSMLVTEHGKEGQKADTAILAKAFNDVIENQSARENRKQSVTAKLIISSAQLQVPATYEERASKDLYSKLYIVKKYKRSSENQRHTVYTDASNLNLLKTVNELSEKSLQLTLYLLQVHSEENCRNNASLFRRVFMVDKIGYDKEGKSAFEDVCKSVEEKFDQELKKYKTESNMNHIGDKFDNDPMNITGMEHVEGYHQYLIKILIEKNAGSDRRNEKEHTPLHLAAEKTRTKICSILADSVPVQHCRVLTEAYSPVDYMDKTSLSTEQTPSEEQVLDEEEEGFDCYWNATEDDNKNDDMNEYTYQMNNDFRQDINIEDESCFENESITIIELKNIQEYLYSNVGKITCEENYKTQLASTDDLNYAFSNMETHSVAFNNRGYTVNRVQNFTQAMIYREISTLISITDGNSSNLCGRITSFFPLSYLSNVRKCDESFMKKSDNLNYNKKKRNGIDTKNFKSTISKYIQEYDRKQDGKRRSVLSEENISRPQRENIFLSPEKENENIKNTDSRPDFTQSSGFTDMHKTKTGSRYPNRYTVLLNESNGIREYFKDAIYQTISSGLLWVPFREAPHVVWPSGHPLLPYKVRYLEESDVDVEYIERLHSFLLKKNHRKRLWPDDKIVRPESLVNAGFSYEGNDAEVVCKICGLRSDTDDWSDNDDDYAMEKHVNGNGNCPFVLKTVKTCDRKADNSIDQSSNQSQCVDKNLENSGKDKSNNELVTNIVMCLFYRENNGFFQNSHLRKSRRSTARSTTFKNIKYFSNIEKSTDIYFSLDLYNFICNSKYCSPLVFRESVYANCPKTPMGLFSEGNVFIPDEHLYTQNEHLFQVPEMKYKEHRVFSYLITEKYENQFCLQMAKLGFFHTGTRDIQMCFCCGVIITDIRIVDHNNLHRMYGMHWSSCSFFIKLLCSLQIEMPRYEKLSNFAKTNLSFINEHNTIAKTVEEDFSNSDKLILEYYKEIEKMLIL